MATNNISEQKRKSEFNDAEIMAQPKKKWNRIIDCDGDSDINEETTVENLVVEPNVEETNVSSELFCFGGE